MYVLLPQDAQCGEGTRVRNISCVVFDGSTEDVGKVVDEEFCGEIEPVIDGNKKMILEETCTVPCPGNKAIPNKCCISRLVGYHYSYQCLALTTGN